MALELIYASRLMRLPLVEAGGANLGRIDDVVLAGAYRGAAPRVLGFVASVQRRRIFVNAGRIGSIDSAGIGLRSGTIDLRPFHLRPGELLVGELLDRRVGRDVVNDIGLRRSTGRTPSWEVATVTLGSPGPLRRRRVRDVGWQEVAGLFEVPGPAGEAANYLDMHPSDVAAAIRRLPLERRRQVAEAMDDERLADLLEELPENEQLRLVEGLDLERMAHVLEEMAPDDATDLLAEMPGDERTRLLDAMEPDEAGPLRRLLSYDERSAGGLMTPEPVVAAPTVPVAEALARLRDRDLPPALAGQVFVAQPPTATPTGRYLGSVGFQRLLREPPGIELGRCIDDQPDAVSPDLPEGEVAAKLATYNLLALPVCDDAGRLVGAVSIDDMLDRILPVGWRQRAR